VAGDMVGFAAHAQRPPRNPAQGQEEGDGKASSASRVNGAVTCQLQEGHDGMHSVSCHVRIGAVVERRPCPCYHRPGKRAAAAGQPKGNNRLLPDD